MGTSQHQRSFGQHLAVSNARLLLLGNAITNFPSADGFDVLLLEFL